jgi:hypothetical protein
MVSYVEDLWPKMYQRSPITNNEGVLVNKKGCDVNWATFAIEVQSRRSQTHKASQKLLCQKRTQHFMAKKAKSWNKQASNTKVVGCWSNGITSLNFEKDKHIVLEDASGLELEDSTNLAMECRIPIH